MVVLAACSSRAPAPTRPAPEPGNGSGSANAVEGGGSATLVSSKVTEADCLAVFDQMIATDIAERPADQHLAPDQVASVRVQLRDSLLAQCLGTPQDQIACMKTAASKAAMKACEP